MDSIGTALPQQIGSERFENGSFHGTNGFALFNGKNSTAFNEYYEIRTGADDHMDDYYMIEKWGKEKDTLWDDLTPALWWTENGGLFGSNDCNTLKGISLTSISIKSEPTIGSFDSSLNSTLWRNGSAIFCLLEF